MLLLLLLQLQLLLLLLLLLLSQLLGMQQGIQLSGPRGVGHARQGRAAGQPAGARAAQSLQLPAALGALPGRRGAPRRLCGAPLCAPGYCSLHQPVLALEMTSRRRYSHHQQHVKDGLTDVHAQIRCC